MRDYKSYMDRVKLDPNLREKIAQGEMKPPQKRGGYILRFAAAAAGVAAMFAVIMFIPGINQAAHDSDESIHAEAMDSYENKTPYPTAKYIEETEYDYTQAPYPTVEKDEELRAPLPEFEMHELIFNTADGQRLYYADRDNLFTHSVRECEMRRVLRSLEVITSDGEYPQRRFLGHAHFIPGGQLRSVSFMEEVHPVGLQIINPLRVIVCVGEDTSASIFFVHQFEHGQTTISYVHGIPVTALIFTQTSEWDNRKSFFHGADFMIDGLHYRVRLNNFYLDEGKERLTEIVNWLIVTGPPDFSVLDDLHVPEFRQYLTMEQARLDPDFGNFIPAEMPYGFFNIFAIRQSSSQWGESLIVHSSSPFTRPIGFLSWWIATPDELTFERLVSVDNKHLFDVSIEPMQYVFIPTFLADDISLEAIQARTKWVTETRNNIEVSSWHVITFRVLYNDISISISGQGITAEVIWDMLRQIIN